MRVIAASQTQTLEDVEFLRFDNETVDLSTIPVALSVPFDADGQTPNAIMENVELGTYTGLTISADAAGGSETVTLSLIDDAGGRFALNGDRQVVTAGSIDYEIYDGHLITVEATNDSGLSTTKTFEILVEDQAGDKPEGIVRFGHSTVFPMSFLMRILFSPTSWRLTSTAAISKNFIWL